MTHEKLDNLVKIGQLKVEDWSEAEVSGLIQSGVARLEDARKIALNIESRFDLAYNAAHALSLAALRRLGYRSESRYIVFQCLKYTLELPNEQWRACIRHTGNGTLRNTRAIWMSMRRWLLQSSA